MYSSSTGVSRSLSVPLHPTSELAISRHGTDRFEFFSSCVHHSSMYRRADLQLLRMAKTPLLQNRPLYPPPPRPQNNNRQPTPNILRRSIRSRKIPITRRIPLSTLRRKRVPTISYWKPNSFGNIYDTYDKP